MDDFLALTIFQRNAVAADPTLPEFLPAYETALQHLRGLGASRKQSFADGPNVRVRWLYRDHSELEASGYQRRTYNALGYERCQVPGCGRAIVWYRTPNGKNMAVDLDGVRPHFTTCLDPNFFQRKREEKQAAALARRVQASAKRRAAKRKAVR